MTRLPTELFDIAGFSAAPLAKLLTGHDPKMVILGPAIRTPDQSPLTGFGDLPDRVTSAHFSRAHVPETRVYVVPDVSVLGRSTVVKDGRIVSSADILPPYVRLFYNQGLVPGPSCHNLREVRHDGPVCLITNYNTDHYGHFLLECFPKIVLLKSLFQNGLDVPILLPSTFPSFGKTILNSMLGNVETIFYDIDAEVFKPSLLLLPGMFHTDYIFHESFLSSVAARLSTDRGGSKRLYVSRVNSRESSHSFSRNALNELQLQQIAIDRGFDVICPETMSWGDQVACFSRATHIAGEYSSGMHNAIFAAAGSNVLVVNWVNDVQQRIAQSCGHRIGFVMPEDGNPRWFSSDQNVRQDYTVDPWAFSRALEFMCALRS